MSAKLILFKPNAASVDVSAPPLDRVISGAPIFMTQNLYHSNAPVRDSGIWACDVGHWRVTYDEWEFCHILTGEAQIADDSGAQWHVRAGDSFIIEPGFRGSWNVTVALRKLYVICE